MAIKDPITLNELAQILKINKSKLNYYAWKELLVPTTTFGKTMVFDSKEAIRVVKQIDKLQKQGKTLEEIKAILHDKNNQRNSR